MIKPKLLKQLLQSGLSQNTTSISVFSFADGGIIAKAGTDENIHSYAALLSNILHEYVEFGNQAFKRPELQVLYLRHADAMYVARKIDSLILCFVCLPKENLGMVRSKIENMAQIIEKQLAEIKPLLSEPVEE